MVYYFRVDRNNGNNIINSRYSVISKELYKIVEFTVFEDFISFDRKGKNKVKRTENHKIKVTIEIDMV